MVNILVVVLVEVVVVVVGVVGVVVVVGGWFLLVIRIGRANQYLISKYLHSCWLISSKQCWMKFS